MKYICIKEINDYHIGYIVELDDLSKSNIDLYYFIISDFDNHFIPYLPIERNKKFNKIK